MANNNNVRKYTNFITQQLINAPNGKAILVKRKVNNKNFSYYLNVNSFARAVKNHIPNEPTVRKLFGNAKFVYKNPWKFSMLNGSNLNKINNVKRNLQKTFHRNTINVIPIGNLKNYVLIEKNIQAQPITFGNVKLVNLTANQRAKLKKLKTNEARKERAYKRNAQKKK